MEDYTGRPKVWLKMVCLRDAQDRITKGERERVSNDNNNAPDMTISGNFYCKSKVVRSLSRVRLFATPWTVAYQAPPSMRLSRKEYWSGVPFPSPGDLPNPGIEPRSPAFQADALKEIVNSPYHHPIYLSVQCCHSVVSNSLRPQGLQHCQPSLSITNTWSLLKLMSFESMMPSSHLILYHPLLLLPSIFPSIRVFSNESVLLIRWPKYWSFSISISPSNGYSGLISFKMDWLALLVVQAILKSLL